MSDSHQPAIVTINPYFVNSGQDFDLIVHCKGKEFRVHRTIVCPQSRFFDVASNGAFLEASTSNIYLDDDDPDTIERMLMYLYTSTYDDRNTGWDAGTRTRSPVNTQEELAKSLAFPPNHAQVERSQALNNALVYAVAEKYDVPALKQLAVSKFSPSFHSEDFMVTLRLVYQSTPRNDRGLHDKIMVVCVANFAALKQDEAYDSASKEIDGLGWDVVRGYGEIKVQERAALRNASQESRVSLSWSYDFGI